MTTLLSALGNTFSPNTLGQAYSATQACITHSAKYGFEHRDVCAQITQNALFSYRASALLQTIPSLCCLMAGSLTIIHACNNKTWSATLSDTAQGATLLGLAVYTLAIGTAENPFTP